MLGITNLDIPVLVEVVYACDASPVSIGIVYVLHIVRPIPRVTCNHSLARERKEERRWEIIQRQANQTCGNRKKLLGDNTQITIIY